MEGRPPESGSGAILGDIIDILKNGLQLLTRGQVSDRLREVIADGEDLFMYIYCPQSLGLDHDHIPTNS